MAFVQQLFDFVEAALAAGSSVLIHCLAGAHRAGTAGIACLMHLGALDAKSATATAKLARPAICPIGDFPALLKLLETAMRSYQRQGDKTEEELAMAGGADASAEGGDAKAT